MAAKRESSRRDFLTGRAALKALRDRAERGAPQPPPSPLALSREASVPAYVLQVSRPAMAVEFELFFNAGQHPGASEAALQALDLVEALEDQLSIFREHSEVSRINCQAAIAPVVIEPRLFRLLEQAVALHQQTAGAFDITSGPLSRTWGFVRRQGRFPRQEEIDETLQHVGSQWLELDPVRSTVRFLKPGIEINFHAIGKGYVLDRCASVLRQAGVENFVLHGGQSSILASGSRAGTTAERAGWSVGLRHPLRLDQRLGEIPLRNRALGTSGSGVQFFHHQGRRYGHVLDPRTGWPAEGVLSATVLAPTAAEADALSTAFYVLGWEPTQAFCQNRPELAVILVCPGERTGSLTLRTLGLDDNTWRPQAPTVTP
jgi:thiamine biosynthesis lipoprotein